MSGMSVLQQLSVIDLVSTCFTKLSGSYKNVPYQWFCGDSVLCLSKK